MDKIITYNGHQYDIDAVRALMDDELCDQIIHGTVETEQEFFDKYICVDYFANDENSIFVLAPGTTRATPGQEYPFNPHGQCVFFKNGLCDIHDAKPNECRFYDHATPTDVCTENRDGIVEAWRQNRQEIVTLLKREPKLPPPNMGEVMEMLLDIMNIKYFS